MWFYDKKTAFKMKKYFEGCCRVFLTVKITVKRMVSA